MKTNQLTTIDLSDDANLRVSKFAAADRMPGTTFVTLYLRLHITYVGTTGNTKDRLQWSKDQSAWSDLPEGGKVILAEFARSADTKVTVLGNAFVVRESTMQSGPQPIELSIQDWALDGSRQADWSGTSGVDLTIATGVFVVSPPSPTSPLIAYHDVDFNIVAKHDGKYFVFDPLVILVPKRP